MRTGYRRIGLALAGVLVAACSKGLRSPEEIGFGPDMLQKGESWTRGGTSGVVYVPRGQKLPEATLQVGVIVSREHKTARELHHWVSSEFPRTSPFIAHATGTVDARCTVAAHIKDGNRVFRLLQVCKNGVERAACAEADEPRPRDTLGTCLNSSGCFDDICERGWRDRRADLDFVVEKFLTLR